MDALTVAGISMQSDLARLDTISQNLANISTPAYKREIYVGHAFDAHVDEAESAGREGVDEKAGVGSPSMIVDPSVGAVHATTNPMDIAIESDGYLEVTTDNGIAYTRQGSLRIDTTGRITNNQGLPVSGLGGELHVSGNNVTIDSSGKLQQEGKTVGQLKLVQFSNPQMLEAIGNGLYTQGSAKFSDKTVTTKVKSGFLEASNVSSPREMIQLTETVRHFESMQKVFQGYDDMFQKTITKLGEF